MPTEHRAKRYYAVDSEYSRCADRRICYLHKNISVRTHPSGQAPNLSQDNNHRRSPTIRHRGQKPYDIWKKQHLTHIKQTKGCYPLRSKSFISHTIPAFTDQAFNYTCTMGTASFSVRIEMGDDVDR